MKPAPRLTIHPMTIQPMTPAYPVVEFGKDMAAFSAIILAVGGFALLLFTFTTA